MEFPHPVRNHREKQRKKLANAHAPLVASDLRDHIDANGDREFRTTVPAPKHRRIDTDREYTDMLGNAALDESLIPPRYRNRLEFNAAATHDLNMTTVRYGVNDEHWRLEPAKKLRMVFNTPAELAMQNTVSLHEQVS